MGLIFYYLFNNFIADMFISPDHDILANHETFQFCTVKQTPYFFLVSIQNNHAHFYFCVKILLRTYFL